MKNLKELITSLRKGKSKLLQGEQVLEGRLRIFLGNTVITVSEFTPEFKPGLVNLVAENYKVQGVPLANIEVLPEEKKKEPVLPDNGPVITQEQILNDKNKNE